MEGEDGFMKLFYKTKSVGKCKITKIKFNVVMWSEKEINCLNSSHNVLYVTVYVCVIFMQNRLSLFPSIYETKDVSTLLSSHYLMVVTNVKTRNLCHPLLSNTMTAVYMEVEIMFHIM